MALVWFGRGLTRRQDLSDKQWFERVVHKFNFSMNAGLRTHAEGRLSGLAGELEMLGDNKVHVAFRNPHMPLDLQIGEEASPRAPSDDIQWGDSELDRRVSFLAKSPSDLLAVFDAEARAKCEALVPLGLRVFQGTVSCVLDLNPQTGSYIEEIAFLAKRLSLTDKLQQLCRRFQEEAVPGIRLRILWSVIREFAETQPRLHLVSLASKDQDPGVRLMAWWASDETDTALRSFLWNEVRDADSVKGAIASATGTPTPFPPERLLTGLSILLESAHGFLRAAALEGLGRLPDRDETAPLIAACLARDQDPSVLVAGAHALALTGRPDEEAVLFSLLSFGNEGVVLAAAKALGLIGTVKAVLPLRKSAEFPHLRETNVEIDAAITRIQSRLKGADAGFVSLSSEKMEGQLALASEGGELSNVTESFKLVRKPADEKQESEFSHGANG